MALYTKLMCASLLKHAIVTSPTDSGFFFFFGLTVDFLINVTMSRKQSVSSYMYLLLLFINQDIEAYTVGSV